VEVSAESGEILNGVLNSNRDTQGDIMLPKLIVFSALLLGGTTMAIEEPQFEIESKNEQYEIRKYPKILVAETLVEAEFDEAGNKAFRILADYIFGNNKQNKKVAMTAPVTQQTASQSIAMTAPVTQIQAKNGYWIQFTMPAIFTMETIPQPIDARVQLREVPARTVAVYRYSGSWSESLYQEKLEYFKKVLEKDGVKAIGTPVFARFNSPFRIWFLRRNEIWLEVSR
jgi:hypothetical protein